MKHQQISVDYLYMLKTSLACLAVATAGFVLIKLIIIIFLLPGHLNRQQQRLDELSDQFDIDTSQVQKKQQHKFVSNKAQTKGEEIKNDFMQKKHI